VSLCGEGRRGEHALSGERRRDLDLRRNRLRCRPQGAERLDGVGLGRRERREQRQAFAWCGRGLGATSLSAWLPLLACAGTRIFARASKRGLVERPSFLDVGKVAGTGGVSGAIPLRREVPLRPPLPAGLVRKPAAGVEEALAGGGRLALKPYALEEAPNP
jgi:hypothetical protein